MSDLAQTLARLSAILGPPDGDPVPLDGGITNRNYRVDFGGSTYVIREPGKDTELLGIDRGAEWAASCAAASVGVGPSVRAMLENPPVLVTEFLDGTAVAEDDLREPAVLTSLARSLRKVHESGEELPSEFSSFRVVERYARTAGEHGVTPPGGYESAHKHAKGIEKALRGPDHDPVPCHNDLLAGNLIRQGDRLRIVDWEYAGMGDRYFDLGNLAVNNGLDEEGETILLEAYFGEPPDARQMATLHLMRFMSDFRESMWGVVQSAVSELDFDFTAYADEHFARLEQTAAHPRFDSWLREARGPRR
jgi:thiamine kinase-like enzyme